MLENITVRRAKPNDAIGILMAHQDSIRKVASKDYNQNQVSGWSDHLQSEGYVRAMKNGETMFVAVNSDEEILGFSAIKGDEVMAVYVSSVAIGKGIGEALYDEVEKFAKNNKVKKLGLSSSITAEGFYQRKGFIKIKDHVYRLSSGVEIPCRRMEKELF